MDDFAIKYFVERGCIAVRRVKKSDLRNIAKACGGTVLMTLADDKANESVQKEWFGECDLVEEGKVGDGTLIFFRGCRSTRAQTIILRGANDYMLDEVERSLHDALEVVRRVMESKSVVPGGGAVEVALSVHMEHLASTMGSREQLALAAFAQAMLIIPKTLAVNGAYDATDLVARLRSFHHAAQTDSKKVDCKWMGLDLEEGKVRDNLRAGVLEPAMSKIKMIRFATEAAITILRIDDSIKMMAKANPSGPQEDDY
jgi:T-complex protein 1 subunit alpha